MREKLVGRDLRSIADVNQVVESVHTQDLFDELFAFLYDKDRLVVMRCSDAIEKITLKYPVFLISHQREILDFCEVAKNKEFRWHLALLLSRLQLTNTELKEAVAILKSWLLNPDESRIVRTNALQSLATLTQQNPQYKEELADLVLKVKKENIPSLNARIKKIIAEK